MDFDVHQHLDFGADMDKYAVQLRKLKTRAGVSSLGPPFTHPGNHAVEDALRKHPDVIIGFGYVPLGRGGTPKMVEDLHRRGFRGLKVIIPTRDYDDQSYWPIYRKAEQLKMPILFHTGVMARTEEFAARYPHVPELKGIDHSVSHVSCRKMSPETLDAIAKTFPNLKLIMAHFGSFGRRDNASAVIQWNPNVYADLTEWGWYEHPKYTAKAVRILRDIVDRRVREQLVWGTDNPTSRGVKNLPMFKNSIVHIAKALGFKKSLVQRIMGGTMEEILGLPAGFA
jgi:predicted TIM-barrel fold metal-dependent hydrolase